MYTYTYTDIVYIYIHIQIQSGTKVNGQMMKKDINEI